MQKKRLDITGKTGPYCLPVVEREAKALKPSDELIITCDNNPTATTFIPRLAHDNGMVLDLRRLSPGTWEIRITRQ
jgi:TusA-related sulfurtransferase